VLASEWYGFSRARNYYFIKTHFVSIAVKIKPKGETNMSAKTIGGLCALLCAAFLMGGCGGAEAVETLSSEGKDLVHEIAQAYAETEYTITGLHVGPGYSLWNVHEDNRGFCPVNYSIVETDADVSQGAGEARMEDDHEISMFLALYESGDFPEGFMFKAEKKEGIDVYESGVVSAQWDSNEDARALIDAWNEWMQSHYPEAQVTHGNRVRLMISGPRMAAGKSGEWVYHDVLEDVYRGTLLRWNEETENIETCGA
jgi:hypothetical protein